jgi:hypothetical protein
MSNPARSRDADISTHNADISAQAQGCYLEITDGYTTGLSLAAVGVARGWKSAVQTAC